MALVLSLRPMSVAYASRRGKFQMSETIADERRSGSKRIQFEFADDALERLERMKRRTRKSTYADVVRDALRIYEWFNEQAEAGYDIGLVKDDTLVKTVKFVF